MAARPRGLFWLAFWVVSFAVGMTGLLLYFKYQAVFSGLQRDRVLLLARDIVAISERDLALGQDFRGMDTLPQVIRRRHRDQAWLLGIDVAAASGRIAYASDAARVGTSLPPAWLRRLPPGTHEVGFVADADLAVVARVVHNGFGQVAGFTVVRYGRQAEQRAMAGFARELLLACALPWLVSTALLWSLLHGLRRRLERIFGQAARSLEGRGPAPAALAAELAPAALRLAEADRLLAATPGSDPR